MNPDVFEYNIWLSFSAIFIWEELNIQPAVVCNIGGRGSKVNSSIYFYPIVKTQTQLQLTLMCQKLALPKKKGILISFYTIEINLVFSEGYRRSLALCLGSSVS